MFLNKRYPTSKSAEKNKDLNKIEFNFWQASQRKLVVKLKRLDNY